MVTATTFKYTIERALSPALGPDAPALSVASDIAGLPAYRAGSSPHISGIRATKNTLAITLVRRAPDFPERIALSYFCPVPIGTPTVVNGLPDPIPSAGPYYLSGNLGGVVAVLRRNPNYRGSRPHRLAAIVYREQPTDQPGGGRNRSRTRRLCRRAGPALSQLAAVVRRFSLPSAGRPRRYFVTPLLATDELAFNTRHGPFTDPRLRRAVSYALDRPALAAALGDLVTDHYLPPGMPASPRAACLPAHRPRSRAGPPAGRPARRTRGPGRLQ